MTKAEIVKSNILHYLNIGKYYDFKKDGSPGFCLAFTHSIKQHIRKKLGLELNEAICLEINYSNKYDSKWDWKTGTYILTEKEKCNTNS